VLASTKHRNPSRKDSKKFDRNAHVKLRTSKKRYRAKYAFFMPIICGNVTATHMLVVIILKNDQKFRSLTYFHSNSLPDILPAILHQVADWHRFCLSGLGAHL